MNLANVFLRPAIKYIKNFYGYGCGCGLTRRFASKTFGLHKHQHFQRNRKFLIRTRRLSFLHIFILQLVFEAPNREVICTMEDVCDCCSTFTLYYLSLIQGKDENKLHHDYFYVPYPSYPTISYHCGTPYLTGFGDKKRN